MRAPKPNRCSVCGMEHGPGHCAYVEHLAAQVMHIRNRDEALARRSTFLAQFIFAVDDLLANAANPVFRDGAIRHIRKLRKRFANL